MTKQYLVLREWLQPGVAYWICEHSDGPKPNRCPHCDFTDADRGRAASVEPTAKPLWPDGWPFVEVQVKDLHEPAEDPFRVVMERIAKEPMNAATMRQLAQATLDGVSLGDWGVEEPAETTAPPGFERDSEYCAHGLRWEKACPLCDDAAPSPNRSGDA